MNGDNKKFTPEEVETFKELYDQVEKGRKSQQSLNQGPKNNFVYFTSQSIVLALGLACAASMFDKLGYSIIQDSINQQENFDKNQLQLRPEDPLLKNLMDPNLKKGLKLEHSQ